jgi:hypothetical protein
MEYQVEQNEVNMRSYEEIEKEILEFCEENKCLFEDKDFPPNDNSL